MSSSITRIESASKKLNKSRGVKPQEALVAPTPPPPLVEQTGSLLEPLFKKLALDLEGFFKNAERFDRTKFEASLKAFTYELYEILKSGSDFKELGTWLKPSASSFFDMITKARRLLRSNEVDDYGLDRSFELAIKPLFDFLYFKYFRVSSKGIENVPLQGRCLLVSNHSGVLPYDAAMIKLSIFNEHSHEREVRFLVDDFVFHFPFLGTFMNRIGGVRACPENAERLLKNEELVAVFPEGIKGISKPYSKRYKLQRFGRGGALRLAMKTKSPIVPVAVVGAEEIHPLLYKSTFLARPLGLPFIPFTPTFPFLGPLGAIPLPTKWTLVFGKPITYDHYTAREINDGIVINQETERLRAILQDMIYAELKERESIFFG